MSKIMTFAPTRFKDARRALLYLLPTLIVVVGVVYIGIGYNAWISLLDWNGVSSDPQFIGLDNYQRILGDPIFWSALIHVGIFGVIVIVVQIVLGLAMAILISGPIFGGAIYKVIIFMPVVLAPAAIAIAFRQFFAANGLFNDILNFVGLGFLAHPWLADPNTALYALALINIWQWTGFSFILYQSALSQLDQNLFEAAQLDGASTWRMVRDIVVPQLRGTHFTLVLVGIIGALKTFDIVYLTTGGGPARSTEFLTTYIFEQTVQQFDAGYAAALSLVLLLLALALTRVQMSAAWRSR